MAWQPRQHEDGTQARDSKQRRLLHALPGRTRNGLLQRPTGGLKNQHFSIALRLMISAPNSQFGAAGFLDCRGATTESGHTTEGTFYFCMRTSGNWEEPDTGKGGYGDFENLIQCKIDCTTSQNTCAGVLGRPRSCPGSTLDPSSARATPAPIGTPAVYSEQTITAAARLPTTDSCIVAHVSLHSSAQAHPQSQESCKTVQWVACGRIGGHSNARQQTQPDSAVWPGHCSARKHAALPNDDRPGPSINQWLRSPAASGCSRTGGG